MGSGTGGGMRQEKGRERDLELECKIEKNNYIKIYLKNYEVH